MFTVLTDHSDCLKTGVAGWSAALLLSSLLPQISQSLYHKL